MSTKDLANLINDAMEMSSKGLKSLVKDAKKGFKKMTESPFEG